MRFTARVIRAWTEKEHDRRFTSLQGCRNLGLRNAAVVSEDRTDLHGNQSPEQSLGWSQSKLRRMPCTAPTHTNTRL